jgi:DNA mismatch repair protein MutL
MREAAWVESGEESPLQTMTRVSSDAVEKSLVRDLSTPLRVPRYDEETNENREAAPRLQEQREAFSPPQRQREIFPSRQEQIETFPSRHTPSLFSPSPHLSKHANYIGTFAKCYLLFEEETKLLAIDQHAFHERILYERLCKNPQLLSQSQPLIMPEAITLSADLGQALQDNLQTVESAGFRLKFLGETTVEVKAVPTLLVHKNYDEFFLHFAEKLAEGSLSSPQDAHHELLATLACHAAVRAGEDLSEEQIRVLLAEAESVDFYHNCPHGRRVFKYFEKSQVATWFDR